MFKTAAIPISLVALRNTLSGFRSAAAMALGVATFVPVNPALAATFANTDAATITMTGRMGLDDEEKGVLRTGSFHLQIATLPSS